jgi:tRNA G18 (ribose-2'-O)-methylase SpoU
MLTDLEYGSTRKKLKPFKRCPNFQPALLHKSRKMSNPLWDSTTLDQPSKLLYNVHTPFQALPTERCSKIAQALALPVGLLLLNLDGNMNIGMSIRTAAVLGCSDVWVVGKRAYDRRSEVGARNYIRLHRLSEIPDPRAFFEEQGIQPILVEQGGQALEDYTFDTKCDKRIVFIMGSESHGIPEDWLRALHDVPRLSISQYGLVRSLNVSTAASIILYEFTRQWRKARKALL